MAQLQESSSSHSAEMTVSESGNLAQGEGSHVIYWINQEKCKKDFHGRFDCTPFRLVVVGN